MAKRDITEAENTFGGFVALMKWGSIVSFVGVAFVILLIS
ncbi:MAG TPA: aa3-type cytochrome c oxidase subunit IV [Sphingobium sp.]|nr:aa3-type cytochrome c oxidase subunit IV [Sphingobium sp.]